MKQTAVEWLVEQLTIVYPRIEEMKLITDKAKAMEKEQILIYMKLGLKMSILSLMNTTTKHSNKNNMDENKPKLIISDYEWEGNTEYTFEIVENK